MKTNVCIDAFNLYYGSLRNTPYKWLDLLKFCQVSFPKNQIHRIRYFTARVKSRPDDPSKPNRQQAYLRALETIPNLSIHYGHYLESTIRMPLARPPARGSKTVEVLKSEEKGSDVNLATFLLLDAFDRDFEAAIVISNDSDLAVPIRHARSKFNKSSGAIHPIHPKGGRGDAWLNCVYYPNFL